MVEATAAARRGGMGETAGVWRGRIAAATPTIKRQFTAVAQTFYADAPMFGLGAVLALALVSPIRAACGLAVSLAARLIAARLDASNALSGGGLFELNGFFTGLACATFFAPGVGLLAALALGALASAGATIVLDRILKTWDLPLMVGAYMPAFWLVSLALRGLAWAPLAVLPPAPGGEAPVILILLGTLRGIGQIFFVPDAAFGAALCMLLAVFDRRSALALALAAFAAVVVAHLVALPEWQVAQGLPAFTAGLTAVAARRGFRGMGLGAVILAVVFGPLVEKATLELFGAFGLPALSVSYVGLIWACVLASPVRSGERSGWALGKGLRP